MVQFNGAIDYLILKKNKIYIIFFLDNHQPDKYCDIPSKYIDSLFSVFYNKNTTFIFEELIDNSNFISLFPHTLHLTEFLKFYNKHINDKKKLIKPIDIRILFDNTDQEYIFKNLNILFNKTKTNFILEYVCNQFYSACDLSLIFLQHFTLLHNKFIKIQNFVNSNCNAKKNLITNNISDYSKYIPLDYLFITSEITENNIVLEFSNFLSTILELFSISYIITMNTSYFILYLGASHCISIFYLLNKYYDFRSIKSFKNLNIAEINNFNLDLFDNHNSCIDFTLI